MRQILLIASALALAISGAALAQGQGHGNSGPPGGGRGNGNGGGGGAQQAHPGRGGGGPGPDLRIGSQGEGRGRRGPVADFGGPGHGNGGRGGADHVRPGPGNGGGRAPQTQHVRGSGNTPVERRGSNRKVNAARHSPQRMSDRSARPGGADPGRATSARSGPDGVRHVAGAGPTTVRAEGARKADPRVPASRFASRRWNGGDYLYDDRNVLSAASFGCPPGLAKKGNGCLPPGQARKLQPAVGWFDWYPVRYRDPRYDWWYYRGYVYGSPPGGGLIAAIIPLLGGALFVGNPWPAQYVDYDVPEYYDRFYGYDDAYDYRYADDALLAVDPQSQLIQAIAALLTGDAWGLGQPMPAGYDLYNVPLQYRSRYADGPDVWYRYSDGYIYQVDPVTGIVRGVNELPA